MKQLMMILATVFACSAFAAANNLIYDFKPSADDCYADGTPVLDYECYALVWLAPGSDGIEITADCNVVDESKGRILRVRKSFRRGQLFTFQVDAAVSEPCVKAGGSWAVYLLDTRVYGANGKVTLAEVEDGLTASVNASVKIDRSVVSVSEGSTGPAETRLGSAGMAKLASALPADIPQPRITGITMVNGEMHVKVADTVSCVQYNLASGATPSDLEGAKAKAPRNGEPAGEIELIAPATSGSCFFKVTRN